MIDATTFCYPARQVSAAYDEHICTDGTPDADTEYLARERENGTPSSGYRPAFYVPSKNHLVVIIDRCYGREGNAKAWMADQIRIIAIARKRQKESTTCAK
ncbi:hypothetical protein R5R73_04735 [Salinicola sp. LHM]|uniref:hypothetical protein n=1 Tax=Salinicola sp. LHM TaxID=3065298 RepID=UPI002ACDBF7D|nr:hypothetical protein [Salinicola sp. LHM]WQH33995.1 hypothetical protein R5R73_04735 [Salinicola sp. LHM]